MTAALVPERAAATRVGAAPLPGAATSRTRSLLWHRALGRVIHAGPHAVYAGLPDGECLGVVARGSVHVPSAIATTQRTLPTLQIGAPVTVAGGEADFGTFSVDVSRVVDASVRPAAVHARQLDKLVTALTGVGVDVPLSLLSRLGHGDPTVAPDLIGLGVGLTPTGDDVVAGWLIGAHATAHPALQDMRAAALESVRRTTTLSGALLRDAVRGEAIPQVRAVVRTLQADDDPGPALAALLRVGHTSGPAMALGLLHGLHCPVPERTHP